MRGLVLGFVLSIAILLSPVFDITSKEAPILGFTGVLVMMIGADYFEYALKRNFAKSEDEEWIYQMALLTVYLTWIEKTY